MSKELDQRVHVEVFGLPASLPAAPYSTDVAEAMQVFEMMVESIGAAVIGLDMSDARGQGHVYTVSFDSPDGLVTEWGALPEAICRAALAAQEAKP